MKMPASLIPTVGAVRATTLLSSVLLLGLLTACGGAPAPVQSSKVPDHSETPSDAAPSDAADPDDGSSPLPKSVGDDEDALQMGQGPISEPPRRKPSSAEEAQRNFDTDLSQLNALLSNDATELNSGGRGCARACSAFNSLKRSADALCELAGDSDQRCSAARGKVNDNQARMAEAGCSCE